MALPESFTGHDKLDLDTIEVDFDGADGRGLWFFANGADGEEVWVGLSLDDTDRFLTWIRKNFNFGLTAQASKG